MVLEADGNFYKDIKVHKSIDVLFFGKINNARKDYINFIQKNGIKLKIVGNNQNNMVSDQELVELICKSKIVLIFQKPHGIGLIIFLRKIYFLININ